MQLLSNKKHAPKINSELYYIDKCKFGEGLFANRNIKKGEVILRFTGTIINFNQALDKGDNQSDPLQIGKNLYINIGKPGRFANHSCSPNAGICNDVFLVALKNIQKGEEIYYDYSTTMDEDYWTMECGCGSSNCRKIIKDFKYLPFDVQKKYLDLQIVQKYIAEQYQETSVTVL